MAKQESIGFMGFKDTFNNEDACREHLFKIRWPNGFKCPRCGHDKHYVISTRNLYECKACHYQTSVTVGTVMERTHLPLEKWFWAIYLMGKDKRGCSAMMLSSELEISYKAAWFMLHRIRKAMKDRDSHYLLAGVVELDENGRPQFLKMQVVNNLKKESIVEFANSNIEINSTISSDAYCSYQRLQETFKLDSKVFNPLEDENHLMWLHTIIANVKSFIAGTFHGLDQKHLQRYLDEFCYRFNRRFFADQLFNRIVFSCVSSHKIMYTELTA